MINSKTLQKLQYADILQQVAQFSISSSAKQKVLSLLPAETYDEAARLLAETNKRTICFSTKQVSTLQ